MKTITLLALMTFAFTSNAAQVHSAKYLAEENAIEIDVTYGGGCKVHTFELTGTEGCLETYPVSCRFELLHDDNGDDCEALVSRTIKIPANENLDLSNDYYNGARISISGDGDSLTGFSLPFITN